MDVRTKFLEIRDVLLRPGTCDAEALEGALEALKGLTCATTGAENGPPEREKDEFTSRHLEAALGVALDLIFFKLKDDRVRFGAQARVMDIILNSRAPEIAFPVLVKAIFDSSVWYILHCSTAQGDGGFGAAAYALASFGLTQPQQLMPTYSASVRGRK